MDVEAVSKLYKCDRCGKVIQTGKVYYSWINDKSEDLCEDCEKELEQWFSGKKLCSCQNSQPCKGNKKCGKTGGRK